MLSTETRLRLVSIANKIAEDQEVGLSDMVFITKWSRKNRFAQDLLTSAREGYVWGGINPGESKWKGAR
eukprot:g80807.t1